MNTKSLLSAALIAATAVIAAPSLAHDGLQRANALIVNLKDGSTLYVFRDGKMAKANPLGRPVYLKSGEVLETRDGRTVTAVGNEVARLDALINEGHRN